MLQSSKHDQKIESLLNHLKNKTENIKSIVDIEEKVRQDMAKIVKKPNTPTRSSGIFFGGPKFGGKSDTSEIEEKINSTNLPAHVKE